VLGPEVLPRLGPVLRGKVSAWHVLAEKDARLQLSGHIALVVLDLQHDGAHRRHGFDKVKLVIREGVGGAVVDQNLMAVGVEDKASTGLRCGGSEEYAGGLGALRVVKNLVSLGNLSFGSLKSRGRHRWQCRRRRAALVRETLSE
jgi:hypothetical protein